MVNSLQKTFCCAKVFSGPTPFGKVLSLGWYDGTTNGLAQCSECSAAFRYDLVAWDSGQDCRIFAFSPITPQAFDRAVSLFATCEAPRWPLWVPWFRFRPPEAERVDTEIEMCLSQSARPEYVVAADGYFKTILSAKPLSGVESEKPPTRFCTGVPATDDFEYWNRFLELRD